MNGLRDGSDIDILQHVNQYRRFDEARQNELEQFATRYEFMLNRIRELEADLKHETGSRRTYQQRAEVAERSVSRNQFAVVLIDGDGYHFNREFYSNASNSGGAQAAHTLCTDVQQYLSKQDDGSGELEVLAFIYFQKYGLTKALIDADFIKRPAEFDEFFWSFTSRYSLFQVVDCGPGKERADAKLRDTYRFYANHAQCKHIFLACCHDNGYVVELEKYRHDVAASKTILVEHGMTSNQFYRLDLPFARFTSTFHNGHLPTVSRNENANPYNYVPKITRDASNDDTVSEGSSVAPVTASTWSTVTAKTIRLPTRTTTSSSLQGSADSFEPSGPSSQLNKVPVQATGDSKAGIPLNRAGQRVDRKIQAPSSTDLDRFDDRIAYQKLCNNHYLAKDGCPVYGCKYDHDTIDASIKNTLKFKARSIPCTTGSKCRKADCYHGHQCPWGNSRCSNSKCAFHKNGLHEINDLEIVKYVPATS